MPLVHFGYNFPSCGMTSLGPIIDVKILPAQVIAQTLHESGKPIPSIKARLLIDTGATRTLVNEELLESLGMAPISYMPIVGVSAIPEDRPVFPTGIAIGMKDPIANEYKSCLFSNNIVGMPTLSNEFQGLAGRDLLSHFRFIYHGDKGYFELVREAELEKAAFPIP